MGLKEWLDGLKADTEKKVKPEDLLVIEPLEEPAPKEEELKAEPRKRMTFGEEYLGDVGYYYPYILQNLGKEKMEGWYAMLLTSEAGIEKAELFVLEIDLEPGETVKGDLISCYGNIYKYGRYWAKFESKAAMEAFLEKDGILPSAPGFQNAGYTLTDKSLLDELDLYFEVESAL